MKINTVLLIGGNGQLGKELVALAPKKNITVIPVDLPEINICKIETIEATFEKSNPDVIINCAAYTAVDKAEDDKELAYQVNRDGAANIATVAKNHSCRFVHVSTDYVFGDGFSEPINETAKTEPLNIYGASKLAGEEEILRIFPEGSIIARTASLHGQYGANFVHTMLKLFKEKESISVVSDQIMSPTWAGWLAKVLFELARQDCTGVVHTSSGQPVSWFEFAKAILEESKIDSKVQINPVSASEYPRAAKRSAYSVLNVDKLRKLTSNDFVIGWREGLRGHLRDLNLIS